MSYQNGAVISEGDLVLLYVDERRTKLFKAVRGERVSTDKGFIETDEVIGLPWGAQITLSTGFKAYLLRPLIHDLVMKTFKRVTQVIYPKDLSLIIFLSGIGPGSRVIELGVGTGFLTATLAHYVGDEGIVYGYELREEFAEAALRNLRRIGLSDRVRIKVKDAKEGIDEKDLDAAFLDIPDPWEVFNNVCRALRPSAPVLVFVPTINQVIKVIAKAVRNTYPQLSIYEVLLRDYRPSPEALRPKNLSAPHTGYIIFFRCLKG